MQRIVDLDLNEMMKVHDNFKKYDDVHSLLIFGSNEKQKLDFSIVIPTYKRVETLSDAIHSCLSQRGEFDYNIIIVDNNPERGDATELFIMSLSNSRIKYYKNEDNIGMTGNMNRCIELCEGEYAVLLHDDDILYPDYLYNISNVITKHPEIDILYVGLKGWHQDRNEGFPNLLSDNKSYPLYKATLSNCLFTKNHTPTGMVFNKNHGLLMGGFDERAYPSQDYFFYTYATVNGFNVYNYTKPLVIYRRFINESLKEETKLSFILITNQLHKWLLDRLNARENVRKRMLSIKINTSLITCSPETIKKAAQYNISFPKYLLLNNGFARKIVSLFYSVRVWVLNKNLYSNKTAVDFI